ncbi:heterokaryon incompatibility protein-domain-containing protein [Pisolithus orientalis]|uniref:heterokaryon incompatibility protein-domain-containing protein n=1 Tax=Pisolithus orientalis TaxID=936130 RepID=UPI00222426D5|nr:heterokaryon incompatibility protein-domain-containing protein [Pisolithus orientalis]KAI5984920.1 heterokaryon incompatibility protein-domain-containing protein [Pisolithus orientalis]
MKLLDVKAVLDRETNIQHADPEREVLRELDVKGTRYAILSHRWGDEVGYEEMTGLMKMEEHKRNKVRQRDGYQKIIWSCKQAMKDGYKWLWIDTCCIDKRSSSELSEAINSMYRWYQNAHVCYAYLSDVGHSVFSIERDSGKFGELYGWSEWFMRGWTLQELIAPKQVEFFNKHWTPIGSKHRLAPTLEEITGIPCEVLTGGLAAKRLCVAQIMSWAADRKTTRVEDRAYSLMGLFKVNMPMLYGEGEKAFQRLQLEIIRVSSDHSIFAWDPLGMIRRSGSVLADDPSDFRYCGNIKKVEPGEFVDRLMEETEENELGSPWYIRRGSSEISTNPVHWCRLAWLRWRARSLSQQFRTFSVNNAGIQVCLPVIPLPDSPCHFRAILACGYGFGLFTIDLVLSGSSFDRTFRIAETPKTYPAFKTLYLTHHQEANIVMHREFVLDDKHSSYHGFTRCGTYPREFTGDTVTLSSHTDDLIVIVYANDDARSRFAVGLGYCFGKGWVHLVYDECAVPHEVSWTQWSDFASSVYQRLWKARAEHARSMPKQEHDADLRSDHFIKHAHLPRSIWAARVIWGRWEADNYKLMIDIDQCPGCCDGPRGWTTTSSYCGGLGTPGLVDMNCYSYWLRLDGRRVQFDECSGQRIAMVISNLPEIYLRIWGPLALISQTHIIALWSAVSPASNGQYLAWRIQLMLLWRIILRAIP